MGKEIQQSTQNFQEFLSNKITNLSSGILGTFFFPNVK